LRKAILTLDLFQNPEHNSIIESVLFLFEANRGSKKQPFKKSDQKKKVDINNNYI